jgi:hypothetical protein
MPRSNQMSSQYFWYNNVGFCALDSDAINGNTVFVLGNDGNLWNTPPPFHRGDIIPNFERILVDQRVQAFDVNDFTTIYTLRWDNTLWQCWSDGSFTPLQVDGNVAGFQGAGNSVFVLGQDGNLWFIPGSFGEVPNPGRVLIQSNVATFQCVAIEYVYTITRDRNLWFVDNPSFDTNRQLLMASDVARCQALNPGLGDPWGVFALHTSGALSFVFNDQGWSEELIFDSNVAQFQATDYQTVYVVDQDGRLWLTPGYGSTNPRVQIDSNVQAFQAIDPGSTYVPGVYVLGTDNNLWFTPGPFHPNSPLPNPNRGQVDGNVAAFQAVHYATVFVAGFDGNLWYTPGDFLFGFPIPNPHRAQVDGNVADANALANFAPRLSGTFPPIPYYWH